MHSERVPTATREIVVRNQPSRTQQKDEVAVPIIREFEAKRSQFGPAEDFAARYALQGHSDRVLCPCIEEPEPRHGRVVDGKIVVRRPQAERLYFRDQWIAISNGRHAVVGKYGHGDAWIYFLSELVQRA